MSRRRSKEGVFFASQCSKSGQKLPSQEEKKNKRSQCFVEMRSEDSHTRTWYTSRSHFRSIQLKCFCFFFVNSMFFLVFSLLVSAQGDLAFTLGSGVTGSFGAVALHGPTSLAPSFDPGRPKHSTHDISHGTLPVLVCRATLQNA